MYRGTLGRVIDALVVASFGGPEGPDDVIPFLENVTRGRGIPRERLAEVGQHYAHFGGVSPLNALNRDIIARLQQRLELPIYFANRNWHPMWADTLETMAADGIRHALVFATSAWAGYSGCRQYDEDIEAARAEVEKRRGAPAPDLTKIRQFHDHPLFIQAQAEAITAARNSLSAQCQDQARLVFTAHSIPESANKAAGTPEDGGRLYERQIKEAAALVAKQLGVEDFDVVWQSRSGPAHVPWLEPDVNDHVAALHERGVQAVIVCPIGFLSDHVEVAWDLDTELRATSAEFDMEIVRAATVGESDLFIDMVVELISEITEGATPRRLGSEPQHGCSLNGAACFAQCCVPPTRH